MPGTTCLLCDLSVACVYSMYLCTSLKIAHSPLKSAHAASQGSHHFTCVGHGHR